MFAVYPLYTGDLGTLTLTPLGTRLHMAQSKCFSLVWGQFYISGHETVTKPGAKHITTQAEELSFDAAVARCCPNDLDLARIQMGFSK